MQGFKVMCEIVRRRQTSTATGNEEWTPDIYARWSALAQRASIFIIASETIDAAKTAVIEELDKDNPESDASWELAMPFETCFFELRNAEGYLDRITSSNANASILGVLVHEISPNEYEFFSVYQLPPRFPESPEEVEDVVVMQLPFRTQGPGIIGAFDSAINVELFIKALHLKKALIEEETVRESVKIRHPGFKTTHRIKKLIHVRNTKAFPATASGEASRRDPNHRWQVMGHWRKHEGIGKDRQGNYTMPGFTWVVPHVKGPEGAPLIADKVRVVS